MIGHKIPDRPWQKVSLDLFEHEGENYLALSDYYSKFFEVTKLSSTTSTSTIKHLKPHFARHGIPEDVITDNGPQFSSGEFATFAERPQPGTPGLQKYANRWNWKVTSTNAYGTSDQDIITYESEASEAYV